MESAQIGGPDSIDSIALNKCDVQQNFLVLLFCWFAAL